MDTPIFVFPAPRLFAIAAPARIGAYEYYSANLAGSYRHKFAFGWQQEVKSQNIAGRTWMEDFCFADYELGEKGHALVTLQYDTPDAHHTSSNWLVADGTLVKSYLTAVPHIDQVDPISETLHYEPGFYRLALLQQQRPVLVAAKLITGPESRVDKP